MALALFLAAAVTRLASDPVAITPELLAGLPVAAATLNVHGATHVCKGPALADVLGRIGVPRGEALRGQALATGVVAHAADGYEVLFSLGELDPSLGATVAIIATECDGARLGAQDGPYRLVLPGDKRPARSVRRLQSLELR